MPIQKVASDANDSTFWNYSMATMMGSVGRGRTPRNMLRSFFRVGVKTRCHTAQAKDDLERLILLPPPLEC